MTVASCRGGYDAKGECKNAIAVGYVAQKPPAVARERRRAIDGYNLVIFLVDWCGV